MKPAWFALSLAVGILFASGRAKAAEEKPAKVLDVGKDLKISGKLTAGKTSEIYHVRLLQGGTYVIDMESLDAKALDPFLRLLDGAGTVLAADDDGGVGLNARLIFLAPATAVYRIVATSYDGKGAGAFRLHLQRDDAKQPQALEKEISRLRQQGEYPSAREAARKLATACARWHGEGHWQTRDARVLLVRLERIVGLPENARAEFKQIENVGATIGTLLQRRRYADAIRLSEHALEVYRRSLGEEDTETAGMLNVLGMCLDRTGSYGRAEALHRRALATFMKVLGESHPLTAISYHFVAANLNYQGKYADAEPLYRQSLLLKTRVLGEDHRMTATSRNNLAINLDAQGRYAEAEALYRRSLLLHEKLLGPEHLDTATCCNNLAVNLGSQAKYAEAELFCRRALAIRRKLLPEEHPDVAASYNNLASNLADQSKLAEAESFNRKALALRTKVLGKQHRDTATSANNLALNLKRLGKYALAEQLSRQALAIRTSVLGPEHPDTAQAYHNLAGILSAQGNYTDAELLYRRGLDIEKRLLTEEHPATAGSFNSLAVTLAAQGKYAEAQPYYQRALAIYKRVFGKKHARAARAYGNLAVNLNALGNYHAAQTMWRAASESYSAARLGVSFAGLERAAFGSGSPLPDLAASLARSGNANEAWQRFEEGLARGTWDDLATRLRRAPADRTRQLELAQRLARLEQALEKTLAPDANPDFKKRRPEWLAQQRQLQDQLAAFTLALEKKYGPVAGKVFDQATIQKKLQLDSALVAWLDIRGQPKAADPNGAHWGIVLRGSGAPVWVQMRGSGAKNAWTKDDAALPQKLRAALRGGKGEWQALAASLHQQRLVPLTKHLRAGNGLPAVKHLIVLPSAALAGVPVEAFAPEYTVSYALSGTLFAHLRNQPNPDSAGLLVLADPIFDRPKLAQASALDDDPLIRGSVDGNWPDLPGTRFEADALRKLFGNNSTKLLTDSQASEQVLDALARKGDLGRYRYVHLATHAEADERFPLRSAVILARDHLPDPFKQWEAGLPAYDGRLTAEEILSNWNLKADLVTLSACETALGKYERGEGFVGFAQALILSGSRSVCLSLWKVDDTTTALLMERFYQNLLKRTKDDRRTGGVSPRMTKAEALAEAKTWLRNLTREEAGNRIAALTAGVSRGAGRKRQPLVPPPVKTANERSETINRPYAHPYYWAAFVLIGDER